MTGVIVRRDEEEFGKYLKKKAVKAAGFLEKLGIKNPTDLMSTEIGFLLCLGKFRSKPLDFDSFQLRFLTVKSRFRSILKARQVGFSFEIAAECLARTHLLEHYNAICVSYNLDDAKEKVGHVKELHDELPPSFQKRICVDSKLEVAFESRTKRRHVTRVISFPSKAPRGKTGDVYLDELAHCQSDKIIYAGATAIVARSKGQLTIGSTPLGQRGVFYNVHTETTERFPGFWRQRVPWWLARSFCHDVAGASQIADTMTTEERVSKFGTQALLDQFHALPIEDFRQEFELEFQDERVSFFTQDLIAPCFQTDREDLPMYDTIERLAHEMHSMGPLTAGFDVGRSHHPSELWVFEQQGEHYIARYSESFKNMPFPRQRARLRFIIEHLDSCLKKFRIDATGLGGNLGEDLAFQFGKRVELVVFTNPVKMDLVNGLKVLFESKCLQLPREKALMAQFRSIKQKITEAGNSIFDVERNRFHHADCVYAIAMAVYQQHRRKIVEAEMEMRVLGDAPVVPGRVTPTERGVLEDLFRPNWEQPGGEVLNPGRAADVGVLEMRARQICVSMPVWAREGDNESIRNYGSEYTGLVGQIRAKGGLVPSLPPGIDLTPIPEKGPETVDVPGL